MLSFTTTICAVLLHFAQPFIRDYQDWWSDVGYWGLDLSEPWLLLWELSVYTHPALIIGLGLALRHALRHLRCALQYG